MLSEQVVYGGYVAVLGLLSMQWMAESLDLGGSPERRGSDRRGGDRRGRDRRQIDRFRCFERRVTMRRLRERRQFDRRESGPIAA